MSQETGKETPKQQGNDSQDTVESLKAKLATEQSEKAALLKETMSRKEKLDAYEKQAEKDKQAQLAEQGKYKELLNELTPKVERFNRVMPVLEKLYELEVKDVPEDKRELIPQGDVETRLEWLKTAKSKGFFKVEQPKQTPANSVQSKTNVLPEGAAEYLTWDKNDPRVTRLPIADQRKWLDHQKSQKQVSGWV